MSYHLKRCLELLKKIDYLLVELDKVDPYGDLLENFAEYPDKAPPVTKRLIKLVKSDLKKELK